MDKIKVVGLAFGSGGSEIMETLRENINQDIIELHLIRGSKFAREKIKLGVDITAPIEIKEYIEKVSPKVVLTETSNEIGYTRMNYLIRYCKSRNIKTIHLLDVNSMDLERYKEPTDYIVTPNENIARELSKLVDTNIYPLGNPTFDNLIPKYKNITRSPKVLFASQPANNGINELTCNMLIHFLNVAVDQGVLDDFTLFLKTHPREDIIQKEKWKSVPGVNLVQWDDKKDFVPELINYDIIAGRNSTIMLKASKLGINTMYIEDIFINQIKNVYLEGDIMGKEYSSVMSDGFASQKIQDLIINI